MSGFRNKISRQLFNRRISKTHPILRWKLLLTGRPAMSVRVQRLRGPRSATSHTVVSIRKSPDRCTSDGHVHEDSSTKNDQFSPELIDYQSRLQASSMMNRLFPSTWRSSSKRTHKEGHIAGLLNSNVRLHFKLLRVSGSGRSQHSKPLTRRTRRRGNPTAQL